MKWTIFKYHQPCDGCECVVGRIYNNRRSFGIYEFCYSSEPYWLSKNGCRINVMPNDHWCAVEDIVSYVENMVEDELRAALDGIKNGCDILY